MADLNLQMILRFVDRATGPARAAMQQVERATASVGESGRRNIELANRMSAANREHYGALQAETMGVIGLMGALYGLTEPAIQAEARLAEVSKFVDFEATDGLQRLASAAHDMVTSGGLDGTAEGILDIVAAAGKMGVVDETLPDDEKRRQLLEFAEAATKMAAAYDISAAQAGDTLALWRQNLSLSQEDAMLLADAVNVLGNSMATTEVNIAGVIGEIGVQAMQSGLAERETAALAATVLAGGVNMERAATGMKNFMNALSRGESMTKRQSDAFAEMGVNGEALAQMMQEDATGAILMVLDALNQVDPARLSSLIGDAFGEEAKNAISPLVENVDLLREALESTATAAQVSGAMEEEYQRVAATTAAARRNLLNFVTRFSVVLGNQLLPMINELMETIQPFILRFTEWAEANPELIKQIGWIVAGLLGFKLASLALRFALLPIIGTAATLIRGFGMMQVALGASGRAASLVIRGLARLAMFSPIALSTLVRPLIWTAALIPRIAWAVLAGILRWSGIVPALRWASMIPALRWVTFIPVIGWAILASVLIWSALIPLLQWLGFIPEIDWAYWFSFEWVDKLPAWKWSEIIPILNIARFILLGGGAASDDTPQQGGPLAIDEGRRQQQEQTLRDNRDALTPDGAMARGGPVRGGFMYRINELGQEFFTPDTSGRVISARDARLMAQPGSIGGSSVTIGDIHVHAAPGQSAEEIARAVMRRLKREMDARGALDDGGLYD